ncbi:amino acid adenylation domain-containing protein [Lentzea sp. NPDC004789]
MAAATGVRRRARPPDRDAEWNPMNVEIPGCPADLGETGAAVPAGGVHEWFEAAVSRCPDATALVSAGVSLSYSELNRRADLVAARLRALGVGPETLVGLSAERGVEMVVGLLGVLKAGGGYVPLDPDFPSDRLAFVLADTEVPVVLTQRHLADRLPVGTGVATLCLDREGQWPDGGPVPPGGPGAGPDNVAYVIYTSGSTGRPKGVVITHGGLLNRIRWAQSEYGLDASDVVLQKTPYSFDVSVWEFFWPLAVGARLAMMAPGEHRDPERVAAAIDRFGVTTAHFVPSMLEQFIRVVDGGCPSLIRVLASGEALPASTVRGFHDRFDAELHNLYGPTEASIDVTAWHCARGADPSAPVPIGRPITNMRVLIVDDRLEPVPPGVAGEICLGGVGLARGYLRRPGLTASRFVPDPFGDEPGGRLYRTGDVGRLRGDGAVEFLGRVDEQVKVRGHRIEPGEIESALVALPEIAKAVVVARDDGGDRHLVAYLEAPGGGAAPTASALRAALSRLLPEFMVPSAFVWLPALPLTANGKLDRQALPAPPVERPELAVEFVAPRTDTERMVAGLWADLLGVDRVGVHDNFFELGGHSLSAMRLDGRLRHGFGVTIPFRTVFEQPTLGEFAAAVESAERHADHEVPPVGTPGPYPLSFAQQRLWFLHQLQPDSAEYNVPVALRLRGPLHVGHLEAALDSVIERQAVLRTVFPVSGGRPQQVVLRELRGVLTTVDVPADEAGLRRLASAEAARPFDLAEEPPLRARLLRAGPDDHVLVLTVHHIAVDGESVGLLLSELARAYSAACLGRPAERPELPVQYADYAVWQRQRVHSGALRGQLGYWQERLAGLPALDLPGARSRPRLRSGAGAAETFVIDPAVAAGLRALARKAGATTNVVALAAFAVLLRRACGQTDIAVGSPVVNRQGTGLDEVVGCFVNMVTLRIDLSGEPTFTELVRHVRDISVAAIENSDVPFDRVIDELGVDRDTSRPPLFQVSFSHQLERGVLSESFSGLAATPFGVSRQSSKFDLTLAINESATGLSGSWEYSTDLFDAAAVRHFQTLYETVLQAVVAEPGQSIETLAIAQAPPSGPAVHGPVVQIQPRCAHELVAEQALRTPDAVAVVSGDRSLTYAELDLEADRVAHRLRRLGVGPEVLVGVCVERDVDLVVAVLGVWKAGGAYVPLDPAFPAHRLAQALADSAAPVVVTQRALPVDLPAGDARVMYLDAGPVALPDRPGDAAAARPENLAYVIYTSGSTGRPKGVQVTHESVVNLLTSFAGSLRPGPDDTLVAVTTLSFDISVLELLLPLLTGGRLVLARSGQTTDPVALHALVSSSAGTIMQATPATWRMLTGSVGVPAGLRTRLCGGEALPVDLARALTGPDSDLWNVYGPTETTVWSTAGLVAEAAGPVVIGEPIANTGLYVLDPHLNPVPAAVVGEIYIGGIGLARGYHGLPGLTARRFLPDPFAIGPGRRMYRTGDLGRRRPDGSVEFLGRLDQQVKIRGHRVEPAEIEGALVAHPEVTEAVVVARDDQPGGPRLVAYLVGRDSATLPGPGALRTHLRHRLPEYMVPSAFVVLPALPLTPNGKLDRLALPAPDQRPELATEYVAPSGPTEEVLAAIWADVLGLDDIGIHDNFFELGGDSILSIQVVSQARDAGLWLLPRQLFEFQTVAELARIADGAAPQSAVRGTATGVVALTPAQLESHDPAAGGPVQAVVVELSPDIEERTVRAALDEIAGRHDLLRAGPSADGGRLLVPAACPLPLAVRSAGDRAELPSTLRHVAEELAADIVANPTAANCPLVRAVLVRMPSSSAHLVLAADRRLVDRRSWQIIAEDLGAWWGQPAAGEDAALPVPATSYRYWADRLRQYAESGPARIDADYWLTMDDDPWPGLSPDGPERAEDAPAVAAAELTAEETAALMGAVPDWHAATAAELMLAALTLTIAAETRVDALRVHLRADGRETSFPEVDVARTVGALTTAYPVQLRATGRDFTATVNAVRRELSRVPRRGLTYGALRHLSPDPDVRARLAGVAAGAVGFTFHDDPAAAGFRPVQLGESTSPQTLEVVCEVESGRLRIRWIYPAGRYREATVQRLCADFAGRLRAAVADGMARRTAGRPAPGRFPLAALTRDQLDQVASEPGVCDVYPLTLTQQGMLFHSLYSPAEGMYLNQTSFTVRGRFQPEVFRRALAVVAGRHAVLRTAIRWQRMSEPHQVVYGDVDPPMTVVDRTGQAESFRVADFLAEDRRIDLEFGTAPLYRVTAVRLGDDLHHLVWTNHHAVLDGWSSSLVFTECFQAYADLVAGRSPDAPPAPPYRDYVRWIQRQTPGAAGRFWRAMLTDLPASASLLAQPAASAPEPGQEERVLKRELPTQLSTDVEVFCRRHRVTLSALAHTAWAIALGRLTGGRDLVFGVVLSGRSVPLDGVDRMVGVFSTTLPMRVRLPRHGDVVALLRGVQSTLVGIGRFEHSSVAEALRLGGLPPGTALFDSAVGVQNFPLYKSGRYGTGEALSIQRGHGAGRNNFPLTVEVYPDTTLGLRLRSDPARVPEAVAQRLADEMCAALARLVAGDPRAW